jgi:hypothetical protein
MNYTRKLSKLRVIATSVVWGACCILGSASMAAAEESAPNPLAAVNNTDIRYKYKKSTGSDLQDISVEGSYMARPDLKLKYELHYNSTDVTGAIQACDRLRVDAQDEAGCGCLVPLVSRLAWMRIGGTMGIQC